MKNIKHTILALLAIGGLAAFAPSAKAAEAKSPAQARASQNDRQKKIADALHLTAGQQQKLRDIFKARREKFKEIRQDSSLSREEKRAKVRDLQKETNAKIKGILTDEQWQKWQQLRREHPGRHPVQKKSSGQ